MLHRRYRPSSDAARAGAGRDFLREGAPIVLSGFPAKRFPLHSHSEALPLHRASHSFRRLVQALPGAFPARFSASSVYQAPPLRSSGGWSAEYCACQLPSPPSEPLPPAGSALLCPAEPPAPAGAGSWIVSFSFFFLILISRSEPQTGSCTSTRSPFSISAGNILNCGWMYGRGS